MRKRPPEQPDTKRIRTDDKQAPTSPGGHHAALRAGRYGGASYPAPLSLAAVVVLTAGRAAKPPVPLSRSTLFPFWPRSCRTAGQKNGEKRVGPARRGRRGKGGGEWTRMRPCAETAPCPLCRPASYQETPTTPRPADAALYLAGGAKHVPPPQHQRIAF